MRRFRALRTLLLAGTVLLAGAAVAAAAPAQLVLGSDGEMYSAEVGRYGDLFPDGAMAEADAPVLALDVRHPDGGTTRLLVPGTEGDDYDTQPALIVDESSQRVFLVWERMYSGLHPVLELRSFDGESWGEPLEINHSAFLSKSLAQLAITRGAEPGAATILHLVWAEDLESPDSQTYYAPIILVDGEFAGDPRIFHLNDFEPALAEGETAATPPDALLRSPRLQTGTDGRRVVVEFTSPTTGRMVTLELTVLPDDVSRLADGARAHIIDIGVTLDPRTRSGITAIAEAARAHIIDIGVSFHPEIVRAIADGARAHIIDIGFRALDKGEVPELPTLAGEARAHIIDIGVKLSDKGLRRVYASSQAWTLDASPTRTSAPLPAHLLAVRVTAARPAPELTSAAEPSVFLSSSGTAALVAWQEGSKLRYRESRGDGWSPSFALPLQPGFGLEQALDVVRNRVVDR